MRPGLLEQRRHLEIGGDVFLAGRRIHDDERVGPRRPGRRIDIATRHPEIAAEAGVSGCHADSADAPSEVARQPGTNEGESRVVLEHSYKYSAQMARETSTAPLLLLLALAFQSPACGSDLPTSGLPPTRGRRRRFRRNRRRCAGDPVDEPSPSKPTTTTSRSTSMATPCCPAMSSCARATRSSAPIAWSTTRRPDSAKLTGAVEFSSPDAQGARQQRRVFADARRAIRRRAVRAARAQRARRGAQHAGGRQRHGDARRRVASPPARSPMTDWQLKSRSIEIDTRRRAMARGAAPASSSRACPSSTCPG